MFISTRVTSRTLIWLTALTAPLQGLPAAAWGCTCRTSFCQATQPCDGCQCAANQAPGPCRPHHTGACCCTGAKTLSCCAGRGAHTCCGAKSSGESGCQCGADCQCRKANRPSPSIPPAEDKVAERAAHHWVPAAVVGTAQGPPITRRDADASSSPQALTAMTRCSSLCRFML